MTFEKLRGRLSYIPEHKTLGDELMVTCDNDDLKVIMLRPLIRDFSSIKIDLDCPCQGCRIWREVHRILNKFGTKKKDLR